MTTRREFIRGAAASGLVFCTCGLIDAAYAQGSYKHPNLGSKRKPVIINGRRVTTIDVHSHCLFRDAIGTLVNPLFSDSQDLLMFSLDDGLDCLVAL